jgi:CBS domain containing-hemolysin-like protein
MKKTKVKELMIPLSDYATVKETDTLAQVIHALKQAQTTPDIRHRHRAVLVFGENKRIVGKLGYRGILKALEPKYHQFERAEDTEAIGLSRFGFNYEFLHSLVDRLELWDEPMEALVKQASGLLVKEIMSRPGSEEYVDLNAPLAEALHQFILGCHQSLLVKDKDRVVGIIRLADLFDLVSDLT